MLRIGLELVLRDWADLKVRTGGWPGARQRLEAVMMSSGVLVHVLRRRVKRHESHRGMDCRGQNGRCLSV